MNEKQFAAQLALLRRESGITQEELASKLHVSPQAVSKWENGRSLPETALLPSLARLLDVSLDTLFNRGTLVILEALYGDGLEAVNVTKRLNRLLEGDCLRMSISAALLGIAQAGDRPSYLTVKYKTGQGLCYAAVQEGQELELTGDDAPTPLPTGELKIIAGCYGTRRYHYDVRAKLDHYRAFHWDAFSADQETFPSDPANDGTEYLTLVYLNNWGVHMATCAEGEALAYSRERTLLTRREKQGEYLIPHVPELPAFGQGMECSWAAALTAALQAMGIETTYSAVMGVSGACYRLAFSSPTWDYSSVDGLVAYDYATPGFKAFGYTPETHCHIEKADRAAHRERMLRELRSNMPVLGINLRVAPEWGVLCGYGKEGADLYCRTKYDGEIPRGEIKNEYQYPYVDNWPFLFTYFTGKCQPPSPLESLVASLRVFVDCGKKTASGGYSMGFHAYKTWAADLRDASFYSACTDEDFARRFSVNQFCTLSLLDARDAAGHYLEASAPLSKDSGIPQIAAYFQQAASLAGEIHQMLDAGATLDGARARAFWTEEKRLKQAELLEQIAAFETQAYGLALGFLKQHL